MGPGGGAGGGQGGGDEAAKVAQEEEQRRTVMSQILSPEARERRKFLLSLDFASFRYCLSRRELYSEADDGFFVN